MKTEVYGRVVYVIPLKSYGDLAFVEHMRANLKSKGRMGTAVSYGVLFRSREEGEIRRSILKDDLIEAIIGYDKIYSM